MDALSPRDGYERVVFMKGAQVGGTEVLLNFAGFIMDHAPAAALLVQPSVEMAKRFSKQRLNALIENSPSLRTKVKDPRSRDSGNTVLMKDFTGGTLILTGANSAVGLRSLPARYVLGDEVDGWPADADGEGDPFALAVTRTAAFGSKRRILAISTPTIQGYSRIERLYESSDQRRYFVPCLHCGHMQVLQWQQMKWPKGQPGSAHYECSECRAEIRNHEKLEMLARGEWRATAEGDGLTAGFHLSSLYAPAGSITWGELAREFATAEKNKESLQVFVNTRLGETFRQQGEAPDWELLSARAEAYDLGTVPAGGLMLTAGVDVQRDRLEVQVRAWGRNKQNWLVDYQQIWGSPFEEETWRKLDEFRAKRYQHEYGVQLSIEQSAIDSGYATSEVYNYCRTRSDVMCLDPRSSGAAILGLPTYVDVTYRGARLRNGVKLWPCNVSAVKHELYGMLRLDRPESGDFPVGYCHHPRMPEEFWRQMCAEQWVTNKNQRTGFASSEWRKVRERNEALDTFNYARVAAEHLRYSRNNDADWRAREAYVGYPARRVDATPSEAQPAAAPAPRAQSQPRRRGVRFRFGG